MGDDRVILFVSAYDEFADALADFQGMQDMRRDGEIGAYAAALVRKEPSGDVVVANVDSSRRMKAGAVGAVAGGVIGAIFPPSIVGMGIVGALGGAAAGGRKAKLARSDFNELGGLLAEGRSGIVLVTEEATDKARERLFPKALRRWHGPVYADADAIREAITDIAVVAHGQPVG